MDVDINELAGKIREMYPEIDKWSIGLDLKFDRETDAWLITFTKGEHALTTHLDRQDAENCLKGVECVHFGVQVGRFVKNYCEGGESCET